MYLLKCQGCRWISPVFQLFLSSAAPHPGPRRRNTLGRGAFSCFSTATSQFTSTPSPSGTHSRYLVFMLSYPLKCTLASWPVISFLKIAPRTIFSSCLTSLFYQLVLWRPITCNLLLFSFKTPHLQVLHLLVGSLAPDHSEVAQRRGNPLLLTEMPQFAAAWLL